MSPAEGRRFGLVVGAAFAVLSGVFYWRERELLSAIAATLATLLLLGGLLVPGRMGPVHAAWMKLAHAISRVTTPILLGIIFFLVLLPAGLLTRVFGYRPLVRQAGASAWIERSGPTGGRSDLERQF